MLSRSAKALLACAETEAFNLILVGDVENDTALDAVYTTSDASLSVDTLPAGLRGSAALVVSGSEPDAEEFLVLLARLRDVHADFVVVALTAAAADGSALGDAIRALGFETRKSPSEDGLVFVWEPVLANRPREWNNSQHWANPENFSRYRW